ncbi:uncharacterized protein LOC143025254 [Oratosquilla oratoria]|uniref:uncharacterized protein LOC143025254 n=1 Tax=Oratosquilla oratoria TaxID=337810 RepID=UPI003F7768AA
MSPIKDMSRLMTPPRDMLRSMSPSPARDIPKILSPARFSTNKKNFTRVSMKGKVSPGTCRLRTRTTTHGRSSKTSPDKQRGLHSYNSNHDSAKEVGMGERIVDFLCFSHDVTLHRIVLSFEGKLEIKDQSFNTLRTVSSATGQFVLQDPLVLEAHKFYRIYLNSRFDSVAPYRGTSWQSHFGAMKMEWGHCAILGGMDLLISS